MKKDMILIYIAIVIAVIAVSFTLIHPPNPFQGDASDIQKPIPKSQKGPLKEIPREIVTNYDPHIDIFAQQGIKTFADYYSTLSPKDYQELLKLNDAYLKLDNKDKVNLAGAAPLPPPLAINYDWFRGRYNYDKARRFPCGDELGPWSSYKAWVDTFYNGNIFSNGWNYYENKWLNTDMTGGDATLHKQIEDLLIEKGMRMAGDFAFKKPKIATISWGQTQRNALEQIATATVGPQPATGGTTTPGTYTDMKSKQQAFKNELDAINTAMTNGGVPPNNDPGIVSTSTDPSGPC